MHTITEDLARVLLPPLCLLRSQMQEMLPLVPPSLFLSMDLVNACSLNGNQNWSAILPQLDFPSFDGIIFIKSGRESVKTSLRFILCLLVCGLGWLPCISLVLQVFGCKLCNLMLMLALGVISAKLSVTDLKESSMTS